MAKLGSIRHFSSEENLPSLAFLASEFCIQEISMQSDSFFSTAFQDDSPELIVASLEMLKQSGANLIVRLKKAGSKAKVICICRKWPNCEDIFFLSDLLGVSLILIEPLIAQLALNEVRQLVSDSLEEKTISSLHSRQESPEACSEDESAIQKQIAQTIASLRLQAAEEWRRLRAELEEYKSDCTDEKRRKNCLSLAHQLKGSLGSLGLKKTSKMAAKIEHCLRYFQPQYTDESVLYWQLIGNLIEQGNESLDLVENPDGKSLTFSSGNSKFSLLLVGKDESCAAVRQELKGDEFIVRSVDEIDQLDAMMEAGEIDCVLVCSALSSCPQFELCRHLCAQYPESETFNISRKEANKNFPAEICESFGIGVLFQAEDSSKSISRFLQDKISKRTKSSASSKRKDTGNR